MHYEGQDSAGQAAFGLDETAGHHDNQDDANAEGGARRQGLDQTMHGCRRKVYWVGARIWGDWVECFHNKPSIPNPSTESYSNGKTRVIDLAGNENGAIQHEQQTQLAQLAQRNEGARIAHNVHANSSRIVSSSTCARRPWATAYWVISRNETPARRAAFQSERWPCLYSVSPCAFLTSCKPIRSTSARVSR